LSDGEIPKPAHFPKIISDYTVESVDPNSAKSEIFSSFYQHVMFARSLVKQTSLLSPGIEHVSLVLLRQLNLARDAEERIPLRSRKFQQLQALAFQNSFDSKELRVNLVRSLEVGKPFDLEVLKHLSDQAISLLQSFEGFTGDLSFFALPSADALPSDTDAVVSAANIFSLSDIDGRSIDVKIETIHGVKGETHLATLLLDVFEGQRFMKGVLEPLTGKRLRIDKASNAALKRLRQAFVALTRPTHLVAVAISTTSLGKSATQVASAKERLRKNGWEVVDVTDVEKAHPALFEA